MTYNASAREWSGPAVNPLFNPSSTVGEIIFFGLNVNHDRVAEIHAEDDTSQTFGELKSKSSRVALNLERLGVKQGDVVCLMCFNHKEVSSIIFGCTYIGATFNCLHLEYEKDDLVVRLKMIKPTIFICAESIKASASAAIAESGLSSTKLLTFEGASEVLLTPVAGEERYAPKPLKDNPVLCYFLTSGSTGTPKIVCISHEHFITQSLCAPPMGPPGNKILLYCPISWAMQPTFIFACVLSGGCRICVSDMVTYDRLALLVERYKAQIFFSLPIFTTHFMAYLEQEEMYLPTITAVFITGYHLFEEPKKLIQARVPNAAVVVGYGFTEILGLAMNVRFKPGAAGELSPRVVMKIINDENERLGPNETGEICAKCTVPIMGYLSEEANKEVFDEEGFMHSGDLGYFDGEGTLYIDGRKKDLIKHKGVALNAKTIEEFIVKETGLIQCCVVGLDDLENSDELPAAAIIKPENCKHTEADIVKLAAEKLPAHKHLDGGVYFVKELPYTNSGKVVRYEVKKILMKQRENH